jgi:hypothetical protein
MAIAIENKRVNGVSTFNAKLINEAVATGDGEWIDIKGLKDYNIHTSGITSATVIINGSNADSKPAAATHDIQLGSSITADGMKQFTTPLKWIKARVSSWVSGTITTIIEGHY